MIVALIIYLYILEVNANSTIYLYILEKLKVVSSIH